jgi:hypothetical protein
MDIANTTSTCTFKMTGQPILNVHV